jgi:hypothetical protein
VSEIRLNNPFSVANQGKGVYGVLARATTLAQRYGLSSSKMDSAFEQLMLILNEFECSATLPVTAKPLQGICLRSIGFNPKVLSWLFMGILMWITHS